MPSFLISCGETSGDILAAELLTELKQVLPGWEAIGISGPRLRDVGMTSLATTDDLAVMGFTDVITRIPHLIKLKAHLNEQVRRHRPEFAILVDYIGFHMAWAEELKRQGVQVIQYVAPQLWAWGAHRVQKLRHVTDLVMGIMPFEEKFFRDHQVNYEYVGTPQAGRVQDLKASRNDFGLPPQGQVIGFFPGSRSGEVGRHMPVVWEVIREIHKLRPACHFAVSQAPGLEDELFARPDAPLWRNVPVQIVAGRSLELMASCDSALVASGTATLECALAGTPMGVIYRGSTLTYMIAKKVVTLPNISLVNLVANKRIVEEFIQHIDSATVAKYLVELADGGVAKERMKGEFEKLFDGLIPYPQRRAAQVVARFAAARSS
jgi:lipid-A-disaccharide synthase